MKYKKILIATILLLAILTMGAVSASEDIDVLAQDSNILAQEENVLTEDTDMIVSQEYVIDDKISSFDDEFEGNFTINENYLNTNNGEDTFATLNLQTATEGKVVISDQSYDIIYENYLNEANFYQNGNGFSYDIIVGDVDFSDIGKEFLKFNFYDCDDNSLIQEVYQIDKNKNTNDFVVYPEVYLEIYDGLITEDTEGPIVVVYAELNYLKYRTLVISDSDYTFGYYPDDLTKLIVFDHGIYSKNHVDGWAYYGITATRLMNLDGFDSSLNGKNLSFSVRKVTNGYWGDTLDEDQRTITFADGGFYFGDENDDEQDPTLILEVYGTEYMPIDYDNGIVFAIIISGDEKTGTWKPVDELSSVRLRVASGYSGTEFLNVNLNDLNYTAVGYMNIIEHLFTLSELNYFQTLEDGDSVKFYLKVPHYSEDSVKYIIHFEDDGIIMELDDGNVEPIETTMTSSKVTTTYKSNKKVTATLKDADGNVISGAEVNVVLGDITETLTTNSKGQVSLSTNNLLPGTYTAMFTFAGDDTYAASSVNTKVTISKADTNIDAPDVNVAYKDPNGELVATIINEHGKPLVVNLNFELNGKTYTVKTDSDGKASIAVGTLSPGKYTATISYKGSSNYNAATATTLVTVTKAGTVISAPNVNIAYKDPNGELVATITNEHGKPLVVSLNFELNGKTYTVKTDSDGKASIAVGTLSPGTYTATITYKGSSNYKASTAKAKVTVTKADTIISAPNVKVAYKDPNGALVATITNEHGKPLVVTLNINLNGKSYSVKTDSNGQASISIDTLAAGTYTATISYKGSSNYNAATTTAKVTVTKAVTIISAPDVSVKYKDSNGKLVSTITNEHGKPLVVSLNIELNGKTYTVKTDSSGQASVSTANLAPGTYTATISYKGSGNYKATSTTAKITVKK